MSGYGDFSLILNYFLFQTEIFDIRTNRWLVGPTMHEIRSGASVVTYDNRFILVAGGHDGPTVKNSVEVRLLNHYFSNERVR